MCTEYHVDIRTDNGATLFQSPDSIRHLPSPQEYVGVNDSFGESGTPDELMAKYHIDTPDVIEACKQVLKRK